MTCLSCGGWMSPFGYHSWQCGGCGALLHIQVTQSTSTAGATSGVNVGIVAATGLASGRTKVPDAFYRAFENEETE